MARKYNVYDVPKGRAHVNRRSLADTTATRDMRDAARSRSFVATCKMREKLSRVLIRQGDDTSWQHVLDGIVTARFATVGEAVAAL